MIIPVHVVSLASATQSRAYRTAQAQRSGFVPIWSDAVGTHEISKDFFHQYAFQCQRALKKTGGASFISRLQLSQNIAKSYSTAISLDDDVALGGDCLADVQLLATHPPADLVCLETCGKNSGELRNHGSSGIAAIAQQSVATTLDCVALQARARSIHEPRPLINKSAH